MGINRWSDIEERKRNETDAKAGADVGARLYLAFEERYALSFAEKDRRNR